MLALLERFGLPFWVLPLAAAIVAGAATGYAVRTYYRAEIADIKIAVIAAHDKAVTEGARNQKAADTLTQAAAVNAAFELGKLNGEPVIITRWREKHVKDVPNCPDADLVRLWDAATLGADPADLVPIAGQPDGQVAAVTTTEMADAITDTLNICRKNAKRLDMLSALVCGLPNHVCEP